jgi:hypothetical protein
MGRVEELHQQHAPVRAVQPQEAVGLIEAQRQVVLAAGEAILPVVLAQAGQTKSAKLKRSGCEGS